MNILEQIKENISELPIKYPMIPGAYRQFETSTENFTKLDNKLFTTIVVTNGQGDKRQLRIGGAMDKSSKAHVFIEDIETREYIKVGSLKNRWTTLAESAINTVRILIADSTPEGRKLFLEAREQERSNGNGTLIDSRIIRAHLWNNLYVDGILHAIQTPIVLGIKGRSKGIIELCDQLIRRNIEEFQDITQFQQTLSRVAIDNNFDVDGEYTVKKELGTAGTTLFVRNKGNNNASLVIFYPKAK